MKNTYFIFYITCILDHEFAKFIFHTILEGEPFNSRYDAQDWISDNIHEVMDLADTSLVFEHIVIDYKPDERAPFGLKILEQETGRLIFKSEETATNQIIQDIKSELNEISSRFNEYMNLVKENREIRTDIEKIKEEKKKKKDYISCWIEPSGKQHNLGFAQHNEWAQDYLLEHGYTLEYLCSGKYSYEILEELGWIRILGWTDPPTFSLPERPTAKQRRAVKSYCQDNACDLPKEFQSY